jgi:putative Mg2+ transporter-C (MgtC) family protein
MNTLTFCLHTGAAALLGTAIGLERQWGHHQAGLRTNALVAFGASVFVALAEQVGGSYPPAQMAGQLILGIGFLGGGVILREGLNVKGLNTAATLWCCAAVGALCGIGLLLEGLVASLGVLTLNVALRPVAERIDRQLRRATHLPTAYRIRVACQVGQEGQVRGALARLLYGHPTMTIQGVSTQEGVVTTDIHSERQDDRAVEDLMTQLNDESGVTSVSWEKSASA